MARPRQRPSTVDRLPEELRELIGRLRQDGATIDEIMAKLSELNAGVSRSAVGRHVKSLAVIGEQLRHSREIATALVSRFGEEPDNRVARLNIEMMHGLVLQTLTAAASRTDEEGESVTINPEEARFLSDALRNLATAQKTDADFQIKVRAEALKSAAAAAESVMKSRGMSAETVDLIRSAVLGVAA